MVDGAVLYAAQHFLVAENGASKSNLEIMRALQGAGLEVRAVYLSGQEPLDRDTSVAGIRATRVGIGGVAQLLSSHKGVVLTQGRLAFRIIEYATCPTLFQVREPYSHVCSSSATCPDGPGWRDWLHCSMNCLSSNLTYKKNKPAFEKATRVVANSEWMRDVIVRFYGRKDVAVIYPPIKERPMPNLDLERKRQTGEILMVGRDRRKGYEIFTNMAAQMIERKFAFAGTASEPLSKQWDGFIRFYPPADDVVEAFENAAVVVCPDQEPPAFNRVPREAYQFGVPVIASGIGGLIESVGYGGVLVDDYTNSSAFIIEVDNLLRDAARYRQAVGCALTAAENTDTTGVMVEMIKGMM